MSCKYLCFGDYRSFFFNTDNCLGFDYQGSTLSGLGNNNINNNLYINKVINLI